MIIYLLMIISDATDINQREKDEKKWKIIYQPKKSRKHTSKPIFEPYLGYQSLQHLHLEKLSRAIVRLKLSKCDQNDRK